MSDMVNRSVMASTKLGPWLSAALDDPNVCDEMKADIQEWFSAGEPVQMLCAKIAAMQADAAPVAWMERYIYEDGTGEIFWHLADSEIGQDIARYQRSEHGKTLFPLYAHPPVDDRVSTSIPVDDREPENTSDKADTAPVVKSDTVLVSDKLRDAVEVYQEAYVTWVSSEHADNAAAYQAAAAVIEADRAALVAEIVDWLDSQTEEYPSGNYAIFAKLIRDEIEAKWGGK